MEILIFGGTVEGRELAEWLSTLGTCEVVACTATEYGGELIDGLDHVTALVGPLDAAGKERLVESHDFACIVDATHPYATHVTASISELATAHGIPLLRLVRDQGERDACTCVKDVQTAAQYVAGREGNILLTTGSKDLATFVDAVPDFEKRLFARMLPVVDSVAHARELGIPASNIIAMQGPFTHDFNVALMRQLNIAVMVTKASGKAGGFQEKLDAAKACGVELVVIDRPLEEAGMTFDEVKQHLVEGFLPTVEAPSDPAFGIADSATDFGAQKAASTLLAQTERAETSISAEASTAVSTAVAVASSAATTAASEPSRIVNLVGIGLGNPETMTLEAVNAIEGSDLLIGAARMLEPYADRDCQKLALIRSDEIVEALRSSDARQASVLFSGDVGFYSGATALSQKLKGIDGLAIRAVPGISSVVCMCARLLTPWQDIHLVSAHGRECDPVAEVRAHAKTFMLTGGKKKASDVCAELAVAGLGDLPVYIGERLSYDDERIVHGTAAELAQQDFLDLAVMVVENPTAPKHEPGKLEEWK